MSLIRSTPFDTMGNETKGPRALATGTYVGPDGIYRRYKAGDILPEGYELSGAEAKAQTVPENRAIAAAPEDRSEPTRKSVKNPSSVAAKLS